MAKKPSAKSKKTVRKTAAPKARKAAAKSQRSAPAAAKAPAGKASPKYGQSGAPWWKQFLPG